MRHVFVETNWVFDYAAPGHHKFLGAVTLLERARNGELQLHLPALCLTEAPARHHEQVPAAERSEGDSGFSQ
jgi:hypothetical protein